MGTKYFNNAGAGIMSENTLNTIVEHMELEMRVGAYKAATLRNQEVMDFYSYSVRLLNAGSKEEIAFVDSASRGWNLIMYGLHITKKDIIVTFESEYGTNLLTIYDIAKKTGCSVKVVKCNPDGSVDLKAVDKALDEGGSVLAISHVAAQGSIVNPVIEIGRIAKKYDVIYIVDGCQAVGQLKVDVQEIACHAYVTAGRKWLRGPRGTGILYVRVGAPIRTPQIDLASADLVFDDKLDVVDVDIRKDAKQFELWEKSISSLLGLKNAIEEYLNYGVNKVNDEIVLRANAIRKCICANSKLALVGNKNEFVGNTGFYLKDPLGEKQVKNLFENNGFIISYMCDWDCPIFFPKNGAQYIFRITPHYYTSNQDIEELCSLIESL